MKGFKRRIGGSHLTAGSAALIFVTSLILGLAVQVPKPASALTSDIVPNGDVTAGWAACTGTGCATAHYTTVDEGSTPNDADYVNTGTSAGDGVAEEYSMSTVSGVGTATSVAVNVRAVIQTLGSAADSLSINLRVNGTLQVATTCTRTTTISWCPTVTFNGSWTQSDVDGMQVLVTRIMNGSGGASGRDDDIRMTAVYATVTHTQNPAYTQASHRWFDNVDGVSPTDPLASQDAAATLLSQNGAVRLRQNIGVSTVALGASGQSFKLQVALQGSDGACDTSFTGETYNDPGQSTSWTRTRLNSSGSGWSDRGDHASVVYDNKMWVIAGWDGSVRRDDVYHSTDGTTWTAATTNAAFTARQAPAATVFNGKMWLVGGFDGTYLDEVWSSTDGSTWTQETTPSASGATYSGRYYAAVVTFNNRLYIIGGTDASTKFNDVWSTDGSGTWQRDTAAAFSTGGRNGHGATVFNNKIYVMGGTNGSRVNEVWSSSDGASWTQESTPGWSARNVYTTVKDGKMWVLGGYTGSTYLNDVWYTTDGTNWTQFDTAADWGTRGFMTALTYNNYLWVLGGNSSSPSYIGEVWYGGALSDIDFYDNPTPANAANISAITGDPTAGGTIRPQKYQESNPFTNAQAAIGIGEFGVWDFSLYQSGEAAFGKTYCFRVVKADGSLLNTYSTIPQLTACGAPPNANLMRHGKYFCADNRRPFMWSK